MNGILFLVIIVSIDSHDTTVLDHIDCLECIVTKALIPDTNEGLILFKNTLNTATHYDVEQAIVIQHLVIDSTAAKYGIIQVFKT